LLEIEDPMVSDGGVTRGHSFQRATTQMSREDDVHDMLWGHARRRDRVGDRNGALEGKILFDSDLLGELAQQCVHQGLAGPHTAPRKKPVLAPRLLLPNEQDPVLPAKDGGDADARTHQTVW